MHHILLVQCRERATSYQGRIQVALMWRINGRLQGPDERSLGEVPIMVKVSCKPLCWKFEYFRQNRSCKFSCHKLERWRSHRSFRIFCCVPCCDSLSNRFIFRAQCISDGTKPLPEPILTNPIIINGIPLKAASQGMLIHLSLISMG